MQCDRGLPEVDSSAALDREVEPPTLHTSRHRRPAPNRTACGIDAVLIGVNSLAGGVKEVRVLKSRCTSGVGLFHSDIAVITICDHLNHSTP